MSLTPTIGERAVVHAGVMYQQALENNTPTNFWRKANGYTCPLGAEPGKAFLLMLRSDLDELDKAAYHQLEWINGDQILQIPSLILANTECLDLALAANKKAVHLCEFHDLRTTLWKGSINSQYNVRIPAPSGTSGADLYYTDSLNTGVVWTWQTMLDDIWDNNLPAIAGDAPTLPYTPDGTPEGFRFIGVNAWEAIHVLLAKLSCTTSFDPINETFDYVSIGATQTGLSSSLTSLAKYLMFDSDPLPDLQLSSLPATVRVFFWRREQYHGIEEDTPDSGNWEMSPTVAKDYTTGITGVEADSVITVWDDLPALYGTAGTNTNDTALQTRADEIGEKIVDRINSARDRLHRTYAGIHTTILPGSQISKASWHDYGDSWGLVTEIWRETLREALDGIASDHLAPPDLDRNTHPLYPRTTQLVQADDGASAAGAELTPNSDGLTPGFVVRYIASYDVLEACWIRSVDLETGTTPVKNDGTDDANLVKIRQDDCFPDARLFGSQTSGGDTRPVYLVRVGGTGGSSEAIACGTVLFEVGDTCAGVTGDTPAGVMLDITDVIYTFPTQAEPNGKVTLVQEAGDSCEWRSPGSSYPLTIFGGGSTKDYYWKLKRVAGSPDTWTLTLHDDTDDDVIITLDGVDASPVMSGSEALMTTTFAWTGVDVALTASEIDAGYDFEDAGAGFCLNPT